MSTHKLTESEYDKAGDFYVNWLDKNVPDRDTHIQPSRSASRAAGCSLGAR